MRAQAESLRAHARQLREELPSSRGHMREVALAREALPDARHLQRRRFHMREREAAMQARIEHVESGAHAAEVEDKVRPYLQMEGRLQRVRRHESSDLGIMEVETSQYTTLLDEYRAEVGLAAPAIAVSSKDECPMCMQPLVLVQLKSLLTCNVCGYSTPHLDSTSSNMSYSDDMAYSAFSYKRQSHFEDWLKQLQAKESTVVSDEILRQVMETLHRAGVTSADVTHRKVRDALKELKLRWCYDYCSQITAKITGNPPPSLTTDIEEKCRVMFVAIQPFFEKHALGRTNFLSYPYCLYKFFQLLGLDEHLHCFNLLKSRDKMERMDDIFKRISAELNWEWIPS